MSFLMLLLLLLNRLGLYVAIGIVLSGRVEGSCGSCSSGVCVWGGGGGGGGGERERERERDLGEKCGRIKQNKHLTCQPVGEVVVG